MTEPVPLTTSLARTWIAYTMEVDNLFEAAGRVHVGHHFRIATAMWANGLRVIGEDGVTVQELRTGARAACNLGGLERWGWISIGERGIGRRPGYGTHRGIRAETMVHLTPAGRYAKRRWPRGMDEVEQRWRTRFGTGPVDALIYELRTRAGAVPWAPPEVSPTDGFRTKIIDGDPDSDADPGSVPLGVLLGKVLTAATLDQERDAGASLPLTANYLRVRDTATVRLRDLPALTGISKEGTAMAVGYLQRSGLAVAAPGRSVALTSGGLDALSDYRIRAGRLIDQELRAALTAILVQTEALSAGMIPPAGGWRGERPYRTQTERILADPTRALPWHPMVLHRGGWPDGS